MLSIVSWSLIEAANLRNRSIFFFQFLACTFRDLSGIWSRMNKSKHLPLFRLLHANKRIAVQAL